MMLELNKLIGAGDLRKAADLMKARLSLLEQQIADADRRLSKIETEDERRRTFLAAEALAPASANVHPAPRGLQ
jgi:hypothetical protein